MSKPPAVRIATRPGRGTAKPSASATQAKKAIASAAQPSDIAHHDVAAPTASRARPPMASP